VFEGPPVEIAARFSTHLCWGSASTVHRDRIDISAGGQSSIPRTSVLFGVGLASLMVLGSLWPPGQRILTPKPLYGKTSPNSLAISLSEWGKSHPSLLEPDLTYNWRRPSGRPNSLSCGSKKYYAAILSTHHRHVIFAIEFLPSNFC
jgi:hypothetical protein